MKILTNTRKKIRFAVIAIAVLSCATAHGDSVDMVIKYLHSENVKIRKSASLATCKMNDPRLVQHLSLLLIENSLELQRQGPGGDSIDNNEIQRNAANALANMTPHSIESLILALDKADNVATWDIAMALAKTGDPRAAKALARNLTGEKGRYVIYAIPCMGTMAIEPILEIIHKKDPKSLPYATSALSLVKDKSVLDILLKLAQDPDKAVRSSALSALRDKVDDRRVVEALVQGLRSEDYGIRNAAMGTVVAATWPYTYNSSRPGDNPDMLIAGSISFYSPRRKVTAPWAVEPMTQILQGPHSELHRDALTVLSSVADYRALDTSIKLLQSGSTLSDNNGTNCLIIAALGRIKSPTAVEALIWAMKRSDGRVHVAAVRALGEIGLPTATKALVEALDDRNPDVRPAALVALASISKKDALPYLAERLKNDLDYQYSNALRTGFSKMGDYGLPSLLDYLRSDETKWLSDVVYALGSIKNPKAIAPLLETYDKHVDVRSTVEEALSAIGNSGIPQLSVEMLGDNPNRRTLAACVLRNIAIKTEKRTPSGPNPALDKLIQTAICETPEIQRVAIEALAQIRNKRVADCMRIVSNDENKGVAAAARCQLAPSDGADLETGLKLLLNKNDTSARYQGMGILAMLDDDRAINALVDALSNTDDPNIQLPIARQLNKHSNKKQVAQVMNSAAEKKNWSLIAAMGDSFVRKGTPGTESMLIDALNATKDPHLVDVLCYSGNKELENAAKPYVVKTNSYRYFDTPLWGVDVIF